MNSDNLDSLFKEQIASLDQEAMPGSSWNPDAGWESVLANLNKPRRKIIFWFSAAAAIIILLGFYFTMFQPLNNSRTTLTEGRVETENSISKSEKIIDHNKVENTATEQLISQAEPINEPTITQTTKIRKPENSIASLNMISFSNILSSKANEIPNIQYQNKTFVSQDNKTKTRVINRTYTFNTSKADKLNKTVKNKNFTFKLGSQKQSDDITPKGILAGL